jgi:hypothetical protein
MAMAVRPHTGEPAPRSAVEIVREMRERNAPRRQRVLRSIERLREIAEAQRHNR